MIPSWLSLELCQAHYTWMETLEETLDPLERLGVAWEPQEEKRKENERVNELNP